MSKPNYILFLPLKIDFQYVKKGTNIDYSFLKFLGLSSTISDSKGCIAFIQNALTIEI